MDFWQRVLDHTLSTETFTLEGREFSVQILRQELEPRLTGFVGMFNGCLFISEEVPEEFREFFYFHEVRCNVDYKGQVGRCVRVVREELERVPDEVRPRYISYRTEFYGNLVAFYATLDDEAFKSELAHSHEFLKSLL